ncbi:transposase [Sinorhizobium fredii]
MIGPGTGVRVYLACGVTDMRKGIEGLAALAQDVLRQKPTGGAVFAFRGRRGDRLKLLYFDGQGFCLYYKILQKGRFPWPSAADGTARLTSAQMAMLVTGRLLPRRFCFDAGDEFFVVDKAVEEVVPFLS